MIDIIIPIYNNAQWLSACLTMIQAHTKSPYQLILVNNGGANTDTPTRKLLDMFKGTGAIVLEHDNTSFSSSCNLGIQAGKSPNICLMNSDVMVMSDWDTYMLADMADPTVGLTGARSNAASGWQGDPQSWTLGMRLPHDHANGRAPLSAPFLIFLCVMGRRDVFEKVGPLDPAFGWGGNEDLDYSWRVEQAGYKCIISHAFVLHGCSMTFGTVWAPEVRGKNDFAARQHLIQKHGDAFVNKRLTKKQPVLALGLLSRTETMHAPFARSLINTITTMAIRHGWAVSPIFVTRSHTTLARETIAEQALQMGADYLLFIDDDQTFTEADVLKIIQAQKPVIAGTVYMRIPPYRTCLFKWASEEDRLKHEAGDKSIGLQNQEGFEGRGIIEVDAVGFGFVCIQTEVLRKTPKPWFTWETGGLGEDITFCLKAKKAGFKIYAHTDIDIGHMTEPQIITRASRQGWISAQVASGNTKDIVEIKR